MGKIVSSGSTNVGRKRQSNEDNWFIDDQLGLYVVCDGMGGHQAGEIASALAIEAVTDVINKSQDAFSATTDPSSISALLVTATKEAITQACQEVHQIASSEQEKAGMGCTLTMLLVAGDKAVMGHVGDSRLYVIRDGLVNQLSTDHTMAAELARSGVIEQDEIKAHPQAHVLTRAIGAQALVQIDTLVLDLFPGDSFVICSDGLSDYLDGKEDLANRVAGIEPGDIPDELIKYANGAGGRDNVTVVAIHVHPDTTQSTIKRVEDSAEQLQAIADAPFFDELSLEHMLRLVDAADLREFADKEVVLASGQRSAALYIPLEGSLLVSAEDGLVREVGRGGVLGETTLLHPRDVHATISASGACKLLVIDANSLDELIRRNPWLGLHVLKQLGAHLSRKIHENQSGSLGSLFF